MITSTPDPDLQSGLANTDNGWKLSAEIVVGTYQEFVLGFQLLEKEEDDGTSTFMLKQSFTNHSHCGSIRAVAAVGKYIVSGSTDEVIRIFNLSTRTEHGYLQQQNGTINCVANFESSYMLSGSEDGSICIWRSGNWQCEKTLKGHQGGVIGIAVHPSGKMALSIGKDKALRTWNLVKGRCGYITNLKVVAEVIQWSPEGLFYAIGHSNRVDVYSVQSAQVVYSISFGKRITSVCFISEEIVLISGDQEHIEVHNIKKRKKLQSFAAHKNRVKDMKFLPKQGLLITVSSDCFIKIWDFRKKKYFSNSPTMINQVDTSCRITCLTLWAEPIIDTEIRNKEKCTTVEVTQDTSFSGVSPKIKRKMKIESEIDDQKKPATVVVKKHKKRKVT